MRRGFLEMLTLPSTRGSGPALRGRWAFGFGIKHRRSRYAGERRNLKAEKRGPLVSCTEKVRSERFVGHPGLFQASKTIEGFLLAPVPDGQNEAHQFSAPVEIVLDMDSARRSSRKSKPGSRTHYAITSSRTAPKNSMALRSQASKTSPLNFDIKSRWYAGHPALRRIAQRQQRLTSCRSITRRTDAHLKIMQFYIQTVTAVRSTISTQEMVNAHDKDHADRTPAQTHESRPKTLARPTWMRRH